MLDVDREILLVLQKKTREPSPSSSILISLDDYLGGKLTQLFEADRAKKKIS